ncbi:MAG TPA: acyltransferase, partial [Sphingobium sp.]
MRVGFRYMLQKDDRLKWVDLAKGIAIFLVAMHHAGIYERAIFSFGIENRLIWSKAELVFYNIRMPLFFLISGFLASGAGRRKDSLRFGSALSLTYVYFLWSMIFMLIVPDWPNDGIGHPVDWGNVTRTLLGGSLAWYLWATVLSFVFACLTQRFPAVAVLMAALVLGSVFETYGDMVDGRLSTLGRLLPFYILGIRCPDLVQAIVNRRKAKAITVILLAYIMLQQQFATLWDDYAR